MPKNNQSCYLCGKRLRAGDWKLKSFSTPGGDIKAHKVCVDDKECSKRLKFKALSAKA